MTLALIHSRALDGLRAEAWASENHTHRLPHADRCALLARR